MTLAGCISLAISLAAVLSLVVWCYATILREERAGERDPQPAVGGRA